MFVVPAISIPIGTAPSVAVAHRIETYQDGVIARHAGQPAEAARLLEQWLSERPNDADARLQYGYALLDLGRTGDAERAFLEVLRLAPDYADARIGLARIAQRRGDEAGARTWLRTLRADNAEANVIQAQLTKARGSRWNIDMSATLSDVHSGQPDWREASGQISWQASGVMSMRGRVESSQRFGLNDIYGEAQVVRRLSPGFSAYLIAGGTPRADYRPRWQIGGGASAATHGGTNPTVFSIDLREAHYNSGRITTIQPRVEQYVLAGRAWLTGSLIALIDGRQAHVGTLGRIDVQASTRLRLFGGASNAPDTSEGAVTRATSLFLGVDALLTKRQILRFSLARTNQNVGASRTEFTLGAGLRF